MIQTMFGRSGAAPMERGESVPQRMMIVGNMKYARMLRSRLTIELHLADYSGLLFTVHPLGCKAEGMRQVQCATFDCGH